MKRLLITGFVTLAVIGTASADFASDSKYDLLHAGTWQYSNEQIVRSEDLTRLPATAAGRMQEKPMQEQFRSSMQDHPSERPSGL
jgi:hypothetical protein